MVSKKFGREKEVLREYPSTKHLPWKPNATRADLVASEAEASVIFQGHGVFVEEKVDGANCAIAKVRNFPIIRNVDHVLTKGYQKPTPAKMQFRSIWNWYYDHVAQFDKLNELLGPVSIMAEWMVAQHGMKYDLLPDWLLGYEVYDYDRHESLHPALGRKALTDAGFSVVPLLLENPTSYEQLEALCNETSAFSSTEMREGVYVKVSDGTKITHRFKMVRQGFVQGALWDTKRINKNKLA